MTHWLGHRVGWAGATGFPYEGGPVGRTGRVRDFWWEGEEEAPSAHRPVSLRLVVEAA